MDLRHLDDLAVSGFTLSVEERAGLESGMRKRQLEEGLASIRFWGRITAAEADYLVAYGFPPSAEYPKKQFYFCTTKSFELQAFPDLTDEFSGKCDKLTGTLRGDPGLVVGGDDEEEEEEEEPEEEEDGEEGAPRRPKKVKFIEAHRLAHRVLAMDSDLSIVPRGAFVITPTHYLAPNPSFAGLSATEAASAASYLHFRRPVAEERRSVLDREGALRDVDFLDPVSEDEPSGVWSIRVDEGEGTALVRSLRWPGYFFVHRLGTQSFGGAYFGNGLPNRDLAFML
ncbi:hypothetical protein FNF27_03970 [Cafeteria roenbergensis]|uniref:Radial spoke head protein 9 homolog n=1 Tax=Cafeteria roenbergensis TaxID=33653 RepID=A0A5A8E9X2_CAFRO|nr:hypothetical protein FNF27_03970 [Cafeteria roenbergensis]